MQNLVDLVANRGIELNNHAVNHRLVDLRSTVTTLQQLSDKSRHSLLGNIVALLARYQAGLRHHLIEKGPFGLDLGGHSLCLCQIAHVVSLLWQDRWKNAVTLERQGLLLSCDSNSSSSANS